MSLWPHPLLKNANWPYYVLASAPPCGCVVNCKALRPWKLFRRSQYKESTPRDELGAVCASGTYRLLWRPTDLGPVHRGTFDLQESVEELLEAIKVSSADLKKKNTMS